MAKGDVLVRMKADVSNYDANIAKARKQLDNFRKDNLTLGGVLKQTQSSLLATAARFASVTAAVSALGSALSDNIATARNFEKSMSQLSSLTGMVGADLAKLKDYAIELGASTTLSASQVADAFKMIGSQQPQLLASGEALKAVTKNAITLSEAAGIDLATAAQTLSTSINQMGGDSANAERYINVLAAASQKGAGDIAWLGEAITKSGTTAKAVGTDYEELVANLEQLAKAGFDASTAGTALRSIIMNLEKQANNNFKPSVVGLTQAFENLAKANLSVVGYQEIAGKMFASQAKALADAADEAKRMKEEITGTNTAEDQAKTNTDNLDGSLKSLASAWEGLNLHINSSNGFLRDTVDWLKDVVTWADKAFTSLINVTGDRARLNNEGGGGQTRVDRQISTLGKMSIDRRQAAYTQQVEYYWRYINKWDAKLKEAESRKDVFAWETIKKNNDIAAAKANIQGAKSMLKEYQDRAKELLVSPPPAVNPPSPTGTTPEGKSGEGGKNQPEYIPVEGSIDAQTKKVQELQKAWRAAADDDSRADIKKQIDEAQYSLDLMTGKIKQRPKLEAVDMSTFAPNVAYTNLEELNKVVLKTRTPLDILQEQLEKLIMWRDTSLSSEDWQMRNEYVETKQGEINRYKGEDDVGGKKRSSELENFNKDFSKVTSGVGSIVSGLQSMGIELPKELQGILGVLQGMSSIMSGISILVGLINLDTKAINAQEAAQTVSSFIPGFAHGGIIPRAAGGYMVPGTHYSGDVTPILANAGEVVLNRAQTAGLATALEGSASNNIRVSGVLRGTDLVIAIDRALQATGRGELATWGK